MEWREIVGAIAVVLSLISYIPYFRGILKNTVKPHAFSWCIWSLITGIVFVIQLTENAGAGSWITGIVTLLCSIVFIVSLFKGEKDIKKSDVISFIAALCTIPIWILTENPLFAVLLVSFIDILGFYPTFRKSWQKPYNETLTTYFFSGANFALGIVALEAFTIVNWLYPATLVLTNGTFVLISLWRRKILRSQHAA